MTFLQNKKISIHKIYKVFYSILLSLSITLDKKLTIIDSVYGKNNENYFSKFLFKDFLFFIVLSLFIWLIVSFLEKIILNKFSDKIISKNINNKKLFIISFLFILLCWSPYILSYFPGGIFSDTSVSLAQAINRGGYNNHNPILYTKLLEIFLLITKNNLPHAMWIFTIVQVLCFVSVLSYFLCWLNKRNISFLYIILCLIYFSLFNLFPSYALSIWKDIPFCLSLFIYTLYVCDIILSKGEILKDKLNVLKYLFLSFLVAFFRNNGIYIVIVVTMILIFYYKNIKEAIRLFIVTSIIELLTILIIQGPIYNHFKINTEFVENLGILFQQVCYVIVNDGKINQEELDFINEIIPIQTIKEKYTPLIVDSVKWNEKFSDTYLEDHKTKFFKIWFSVLKKNPNNYIKSYFLSTVGFWDVNKQSFAGYINMKTWGDSNLYIGVYQHDILEETVGFSIRDIIYPKKAYSSAIFLFILLFGIDITLLKKKYNLLIPYLPALLCYLTIMIAVPIAFSMRYVYIVVMLAPLFLILPFLKNEIEN